MIDLKQAYKELYSLIEGEVTQHPDYSGGRSMEPYQCSWSDSMGRSQIVLEAQSVYRTIEPVHLLEDGKFEGVYLSLWAENWSGRKRLEMIIDHLTPEDNFPQRKQYLQKILADILH